MTSVPHVQIPRTWTPYLRWAFVLIIAGFILSSIVSIYAMRNAQDKVQSIVTRALGSVELASKLSRDIDQERDLFQAHIMTTEPVARDRIEQELAATDTRIAAISEDYEPTITDEVERASWEKLQNEIASVRPAANRALGYSRLNHSEQAKAVMKALRPAFEQINETTEALVQLNHDRAEAEVAQIRALHRTAVVILSALTILWGILALFTARWVTRLIRERERRMREATALLEDRNRELDAFAGRVAHDLRGPLTAINLAASDKWESANVVTSAVFRRGVRQMEAIIQDLLTLSRISAQAADATCETVNVSAFAEQDLRPNVDAAGGVLDLNVAPATVSCSEGLLRQVLWNLGENAVKYHRPEVPLRIEIEGRVLPHDYEFIVSDNGKGMTPLEVRRAFEPFFRGAAEQETPGTGLGLSIVKRVVEANRGSVACESVSGEGTRFKVRLPLAPKKAA